MLDRMGQFHIYTGDGKGKTTAACGIVLRLLFHGGKAVVFQFLKDGSSGEIQQLSALGAQIFPTSDARMILNGQVEERDILMANRLCEKISSLLSSDFPPDLILLDEVLPALSLGLLSMEFFLQMTALARELHVEWIATGRSTPEILNQLFPHADLITRMEAVKHYFGNEQLTARRGIEY